MATGSEQTVYLAVNSANRLQPTTTTPAQYRVRIPSLVNLKRVRLTSFEMVNSGFTLTEQNNIVDWVYNGTTYATALPTGIYSVTDLASAVDTYLNAALGVPPSTTITVAYDSSTSRITVNSAGFAFQFLFASGANAMYSPAKLLGFPALDTALAASVTAPYAVSTMGDDYVYLCVRGWGVVLNTEGIGDAFAKLIWSSPTRYATYNSFAGGVYEFIPFVPRLDYIDVELRRPNGQLYDFNGVDHSFTLEVQLVNIRSGIARDGGPSPLDRVYGPASGNR